jgi:hypothetical protein
MNQGDDVVDLGCHPGTALTLELASAAVALKDLLSQRTPCAG